MTQNTVGPTKNWGKKWFLRIGGGEWFLCRIYTPDSFFLALDLLIQSFKYFLVNKQIKIFVAINSYYIFQWDLYLCSTNEYIKVPIRDSSRRLVHFPDQWRNGSNRLNWFAIVILKWRNELNNFCLSKKMAVFRVKRKGQRTWITTWLGFHFSTTVLVISDLIRHCNNSFGRIVNFASV